ncbi:MAG TPA: hypothetical protein VLX30_07975 [Burkholderiales bacterium]|nr:hypothetical protein [Burkholderiales bacterium]
MQGSYVTLYDTQDHANAGGTEGRVNLTSPYSNGTQPAGAGTQQRFVISTPLNASLRATTAHGDIYIEQLSGDLPIDQVVASTLGTVSLSSPGGITVASGYQGLVSGGEIDLDAQGGGVGNSSSTPLQLDSPGVTDFAKDKLTLTATGDVYLKEKTGDLRVNYIHAGGNVWIDVPNGSLVDENTNAHVDQRTEAQLLAGVWSNLQLTDATGYHQKVQAAINSFVSAKEQEYQTYWQFRDEQPDPSVYDPSFQVVLSPTELAYYTSIGYGPDEIATLENTRTAEYHVLHATYAGYDDPIVNSANSTIYLGNTSALHTGDQLTYDDEGGGVIGGLTQGMAYYVQVMDGGLVKLYDSASDAAAGGSTGLVVLTSTGSGDRQRFTAGAQAFEFNPTGTTAHRDPIVNTGSSTIVVGFTTGLQTGDQVSYDAEGGAPIGGLTSGANYYVSVVGDGTIQLYDTQAHALAGGSTGLIGLSSGASGSAQSLSFSPSIRFNPTADQVINVDTDSIYLADTSSLHTGDALRYDDEGGSAIGGLTQGATYYVRLQSDGTIALYDSAAHATAGGSTGLKDLTSTGSGDEHMFVTAGTQTVTFNPTGTTTFIYTPTPDEVSTLTAGIKEWTPDELLYAYGAGLLKNVTDTVPVVKDPDVTGADVTLITGQSVGQTGGSIVIDLSHEFTTDERVALAAAERLDVQYLAAAPLDATVNFSGNTITRLSGDSFSSLQVGMYITVDGNGQTTQNATNSNVFYQITGISVNGSGQTVLTLDSSLVTEYSKPVSVGQVVLDPVFSAIDSPQSVDVHFVGNHLDSSSGLPVPPQIVRDDSGSWIDDGYQVGDLLRLTGSADNTTGDGTVYTVTAVTADTLTLALGDAIQSEASADTPESVSITRGEAPAVAFIKVEQITAFKVNATGQIDITAGAGVLLDSDTDIRIDQVVAGSSHSYQDNIRIKGAESILDATDGTRTNIIGEDLVLEAASGTIGQYGGIDLPVTIDTVMNGTLTARAAGVVNIYATGGASGGDNMNLESVYSQGDDVYLSAYNSILDGLHNDFVKIEANYINLTALHGSIGEMYLGAPDYVDIDAPQNPDGLIDATAYGDIWLNQTELDLYVHDITSTHGDVNLQAALSILDPADDMTYVFGNSMTLNALAGGVGLASNPFDVYSHYSGAGTVSASSNLLNIYLVQKSNSSLPNPNDLYLGTVQTGATEVAFITAPEGSIYNGLSSGANVLGGNTLLFARDDIGQETKRITTQVGHIEAQSTTGSTWVDNNGDLSIGGSFTDSAFGMIAGGSVNVSASSPVTQTKSIISGGDIVIVALDDSADDNLVIDALDIYGQPLFLKAAGSIRLLAGDNLTVQAGALVEAAVSIELQGDYQGDGVGNPVVGVPNRDPGLGSVIEVDGTLEAPQITILGEADNDTITTTGQLLATFAWGTPAAWDTDFGVLTPEPGYPGVSTVSQITIDGQGGQDQVNLWGTINADSLTLNGGAGNDVIVINPDNPDGHVLTLQTHLIINGNDGDDLIVINKIPSMTTYHHGVRDTIDIDGGEGSDSVVVNITGGDTDYLINDFDTGTSGTDLLTVNGTDAADNFLLRASANPESQGGVAFIAALHGDPVANVERVNYGHSLENLVLNAAGGDDTVTLDDNWAATTINGGDGNDTFQIGQIFKSPRDAAANVAPNDVFQTTLTTRGYLSNGASYATTINGDDGNDNFTVFRNLAVLTLNGDDGDDVFTIRAFALEGSTDTDVTSGGGSNLVQYVLNAPVHINGGSGTDTVRVIGTEFADSVVITSTAIIGAGISVDYTGIERLDIDLAEGDDTYYVLSTAAGVETHLYGGLGSDHFVIGGDVPELMSGKTVLYPATTGPHDLSGIQGPLYIDGGLSAGTAGGLGTPVMLPGETNNAPSDGAVLAYSGTGAAGAIDTVVVDTAALSAVVAAVHATDPTVNTIDDLVGRTLEISSGPGLGRFWLIQGFGGTDTDQTTITLKNPTEPDPEWGLPDSTSEFAITHLSQNFFVSESEQVDFVDVYNDASQRNDVGNLSANLLTGLNMGGFINYQNMESLEVYLGSGNDTFNVTGSMARDDGFRVQTEVHTAGGDDTVNIALQAGVDGPFAVDTGEGDDTVDGSASTAPLVIFGGGGQDTILGGQGSDMIFGDRGQVDYYDAGGTLVTRLGIGLDQLSFTDTSSPYYVPIMQTDGGNGERIIAVTRDTSVGDVDSIDGYQGNDVIMGGAAGDTITANIGGKIILGDFGEADLFGATNDVFSIDPDLGGSDHIIGGSDGVGNIMIGGAGADYLSGGSGDDVILGDGGYVHRDAANVVTQVNTIDPSVGGDDIIDGGAGTDVIMGGAGNDQITAPLGGKIILGDNGVADLAGPDRDVYSTDPDIGGIDTIVGGADGVGNVIIGGAMGDQLSGGSGDDVMLGDSGYVQRAADGSLIKVYTIDPGVGGADNIQGGAGTDVIMGGADGDIINAPLGGKIILGDNGVADLAGPDRDVYSTDPDIGGVDYITGGADGVGNIIIGGAEGDQISGGSGDDVILGDSGFVQRGADASLISVYTIAPDVGGVDYIDGGAGFDVILGGAAGDFITTTSGGKIILGDNGQVNMIGSNTDVFTTDPSIGGSDTITVGSGTSIILGGADGDIINGGSDQDIIFGDNGHVYRDSNRVVQRVETTDPSIGGSDLIYGNGGDDIIFGGAAGDEIHAGEGNDIVLGDNGFINYAAGAPQLIEVSDPTIGGNDWIEGNGGSDIVIGGTGADLLSGDTGTADSSGASDARDVMFGDHAMVDLSLPAGANFFSIYTGSADGGGNDVMYGNGGDDLMMGGQGADTMYGGDGDDDMIGGHNVPFGSDGDDTMYGGAGADVMIGDNGNIIRSVNPATGDWVRNPAPFNDPVRQVVLYDILDGVGGNDVMSGGDGNDIMYGQSGNDTMSGGAGDDEMYGGLGDDTMTGDAGNDVMLGGLGQIIRAFNPDGTPLLNPDGSWHKDVLLTDVAYIVGSIAMEGPNVPCGDLATVNALMNSDVALLTGAYNADGSKQMLDRCDWNTQAILLDLVSDGNDTISGGDGNDAIYGQLGNDTLSGGAGNDFIAGGTGNDVIDGGDGNDTLVGDDAFIDTTNPAMPNVTHGFLVVHTASSTEASLGINLGQLGTTIVPMVPVEPGREVDAASFLLPDIFGTESAVPLDNSLHTNGGGKILPYVSVIMDYGNHLALLHGNDTITGDNGDDTLVGDDMVVLAPSVTMTAANATRAETITRAMLDVSDDFSDMVHRQFALLGCDWSHYWFNYQDCDTLMIDNVYSIGNDTLDGGAGNDVVIGDDSTMIAPTFVVPANLSDYFETYQNASDDAGDQIVDTVQDFVQLENGLRDTLIQVTSGRHTVTEVQHHVDLIMMGDDTLSGGDGNDFIVGDAYQLRAPVVTITQPLPGCVWDDRGFQDWRDEEGWYGRGERASWWYHDGWYNHDGDRLDAIEVDSDTIYGGAGNDLIYGDSTAMIGSTIIRAHGVSSRDYAGASNDVAGGLSRLMEISGGTDLWLDFNDCNHDHSHDNYCWLRACDQDFERAHHHDNDDGDIIYGGDGDDIIFGQDGTDQLHGDAGNDWLMGGNSKDLLDGGSGKNKIYQNWSNSSQLRDLVEDAVPTIDLTGSSGSFFGAPAQDQDGKGCAPWLDDFLNNLGRDDSQCNPNAGICVQIDSDFQVLPTSGKH